MRIDLKRADYKDAETIWKMQVEAFQDLYNKYHDTDTSPVTEPLEKVIFRLNQPFTYFYIIWLDDNIVGASNYWEKLKQRLNEEGANQLLTNCQQLKLFLV